MQWPNLLGTAEERSYRIAAAVIELDDIVQGRSLAIAEVRGRAIDLTKTFRAPQSNRDCLAAEIAIPVSRRIIAEVSVHIKVAICDRGIADERLVGNAASFRGIGVR